MKPKTKALLKIGAAGAGALGLISLLKPAKAVPTAPAPKPAGVPTVPVAPVGMPSEGQILAASSLKILDAYYDQITLAYRNEKMDYTSYLKLYDAYLLRHKQLEKAPTVPAAPTAGVPSGTPSLSSMIDEMRRAKSPPELKNIYEKWLPELEPDEQDILEEAYMTLLLTLR